MKKQKEAYLHKILGNVTFFTIDAFLAGYSATGIYQNIAISAGKIFFGNNFIYFLAMFIFSLGVFAWYWIKRVV